jgi:hypothetical protein
VPSSPRGTAVAGASYLRLASFVLTSGKLHHVVQVFTVQPIRRRVAPDEVDSYRNFPQSRRRAIEELN